MPDAYFTHARIENERLRGMIFGDKSGRYVDGDTVITDRIISHEGYFVNTKNKTFRILHPETVDPQRAKLAASILAGLCSTLSPSDLEGIFSSGAGAKLLCRTAIVLADKLLEELK